MIVTPSKCHRTLTNNVNGTSHVRSIRVSTLKCFTCIQINNNRWESRPVGPDTVEGLGRLIGQLRRYSGNTLSPLSDYGPIRKGLLVCH